MKKKISCLLVLMLLIGMAMPTAAFAETESIDFGKEAKSILPEALSNGYAEKSFIVDGEEHKVSIKLEKLDENGNVIDSDGMNPAYNPNVRSDLGLHIYEATAGRWELTYTYEGEMESVMKLTTEFTISNGLTTISDISNDVYMIPITGMLIDSEDTNIEVHSYRSFTSSGRTTMSIAGMIGMTVYMDAFFYLDYPFAGDWDYVYLSVDVSGDAT